MKRLIFALSLALLAAFIAMPGFAMAYGFDDSGGQGQLTAPGCYQTVAYSRNYRYDDWRDRDYYDYDRPYYGYDPYYDYDPYYPYYDPGFSVDVPFLHFRLY